MNLNYEFEKVTVVWKATIKERELIQNFNSYVGQLNIWKSLTTLRLEKDYSKYPEIDMWTTGLKRWQVADWILIY